MFGMGQMNPDEMMGKLNETMELVKKINLQFKDPVSLVLAVLGVLPKLIFFK